VNWLNLKGLTFSNFGPFVGSYEVPLPETGLLLIRGKVSETGDGSGAGKSFLLNSIPYVYGGCPFASTELQSWYSEEAPSVKTTLETPKGLYSITRNKGLFISGGHLESQLKGKAAEAALDSIFDMDSKTRAQITYRPQRKPGLFLSMSDPEKKSFLSKLLDLDKYEKISIEANKAVTALEKELTVAKSVFESHETSYQAALLKTTEITINPEELATIQVKKQQLQTTQAYLEASLKQIEENINHLRHDSNEEKDDALSVVKGKIAAINNLDKPEEIDSLKEQIIKLRERLDKCKKYDADQKLVVQKLKSDLEAEITNIKTSYKDKLTKVQTSYNTDISRLNIEITKLTPSKTKLEKLKVEETTLRSSNCPKCERQWDQAKIHLEQNLKDQKAEEENLERLQELKDGAATLEDSLKNDTKSLQDEGKVALQDKQQALAVIKDPEPHPAGIQVQERIAAVTAEMEAAEAAFRKDKQVRLEKLFQEEKDISKEFNDKLNTAILAEKDGGNKLQEELKQAVDSIRKLDQEVSSYKQNEAIKKERVKNAEAALKLVETSKVKKDEIEQKCNLENDVVALVGRTGFLGAIFNDVLTEIAAQTNDILGQVANVRHLTIDFETEKEAVSTGNISSRIIPIIYNRGRKVTFDAGISGGMQAAVELGVDLAVGNVVSSRRGVYPNFLILDESLHGLGGVAKESCIEMLQSVAGERLVLVVDHSTEFCNLFNQVIEVEQVDGISRIV
jgi:DNA repair exonuclease SbcCD ATPase subunit